MGQYFKAANLGIISLVKYFKPQIILLLNVLNVTN